MAENHNTETGQEVGFFLVGSKAISYGAVIQMMSEQILDLVECSVAIF